VNAIRISWPPLVKLATAKRHVPFVRVKKRGKGEKDRSHKIAVTRKPRRWSWSIHTQAVVTGARGNTRSSRARPKMLRYQKTGHESSPSHSYLSPLIFLRSPFSFSSIVSSQVSSHHDVWIIDSSPRWTAFRNPYEWQEVERIIGRWSEVCYLKKPDNNDADAENIMQTCQGRC